MYPWCILAPMSYVVGEAIAASWQNGVRPRVHPNGFLQLDLPDQHRLHIWPDALELPRPAVDMPIHDHTFSFASTILTGSLTNIVHEPVLDDEGGYHMYEILPFVATGRHTPFERTDANRYRFDVTETETNTPGQKYDFAAFRFHESVPHGLTATVICIGAFDRTRRARVGCPIDQVPDGSFRRDCLEDEVLWSIIGQLDTEIADIHL
jgi:hypothetical protein